MPTVKQILSIKGRDVFMVPEDGTVLQALEVMAEKNIGSVFIAGEAGNLVGIFSERDYARKVVLKGRTSRETLIKDVMTSELKTVSPDAPLDECMALMTESRIRHLPVMENGELSGVISIGDVVKAVIREQQAQIRDMESYIQGGVGN